MTGRVFDNHFHLNYNGNFVESAKRFKKAGGTSINLTNLPDYSIPVRDYYETVYQRTIAMAERVSGDLQMDVVVTIGPYPLDLINLSKNMEESVEMVKEGIMRAIRLCDMGKANAIGEIGRPHFPVDSKYMEKSNEILEYAFSLCKDSGIPAILHTEDLNEEGIREIENMASRAGMKGEMVVKHHAKPENLSVNSSINMSIPANRSDLRKALETGKFFLMETDFVDDPSRPEKYLPADAVPNRAIWIEQEYEERGREILQKAFVEIPNKLFGEESFKY